MCCRGAWVVCVGVGGSPVIWRVAAAFAFAVALLMRSAGRRGLEDEVEDVDEAEDEEEVVFLEDAGLRCDAGSCGFVGAGFRCCHSGEDGGHVLRL